MQPLGTTETRDISEKLEEMAPMYIVLLKHCVHLAFDMIINTISTCYCTS